MYDSIFDSFIIGEPSYDINIDCDGNKERNIGGAVVYSAFADAFTGHKTAVLPKSSMPQEKVKSLFASSNLITVFPVHCEKSTSIKNQYLTKDKEKRICTCLAQIEPYIIEEIPEVKAKIYHIAGLVAGDVPEKIISYVSKKGKVAVDAQGFLRRNENGKMNSRDWKNKKDFLPLIDFFKTDAAEAEILTGETDRKKAAKILFDWGAKEIMISHNTEILVYNGKKFYTYPILSRNFSGRTGRGDTVFGSYINERLSNEIDEALRFSTGLVSLKMEAPGPFKGTRRDVEKYILERN